VDAAATLDLAAIHRAQRANDVAALKREREAREARQALTAAREQEAQARHAAQRDHAHAVMACHSTGADNASMAPGELLLRFRFCERMARTVSERLTDVQSAAQALQEQQAQMQERARAFARAEQRLAQAREHTEEWRQREQLALELEDEPRRTG
jgi:predicted esterase